MATGKSFAQGKEYAIRNRDMLSAPVGLGSRKPDATGFPTTPEILRDQVYGMGAYPMDTSKAGTPLAVFELRNMSTNLGKTGPALPPYSMWWEAALHTATERMNIPQPVKK